jgi:hypothetical protein
VALLLALPVSAPAQTNQPAGTTAPAKSHAKKHKQTAATKEALAAPLDLTVFATNLAPPPPPPDPPPAHSLFSLFTPDDTMCPDGYTSHEPPCMGTYPQADPNYHGSQSP